MKNYVKLAKWAMSDAGKKFLEGINHIRLRAVKSAEESKCKNPSCKSLQEDVLALNANLTKLDETFELGL